MKSDLRPPLLALLACAWLAAEAAGASSNRVTVGYRDLVDENLLVRTGQTLSEVLRSGRNDPSTRALLQPFLDGQARLLPEALEMVTTPSMTPFMEVSAAFDGALREPAWVAVLRSGRVLALADGLGRVRLFLPGTDARAAYRRHYPLLRHCLAGLVRDSAPLTIEVYSFVHDYLRSEFVLGTEPYVFTASRFPVPEGRKPVNLTALAAFFEAGQPLAGAQIDAGEGLALLAFPGPRPLLDGAPVTLADFATAYRAVFHAGDNAAFISLDPHADPTRATVNFGGYLENTRIGRTVLESDKRFKTIASGLDPGDFRDRRFEIRALHPGFLSAVEIDLGSARDLGDRWIGTRFWFYPESVEIETDPAYSTAIVRRARFTADAERQRGDYGSSEEFERQRRRQLSPSIRHAIADLNRHYDSYALLFGELRELNTVARLLGVCSWLKRRPRNDLDLDALMSVEIPRAETPRDRTQLLAAAWLVLAEGETPTVSSAAHRARTVPLTPLLDRTVAEVFPSGGEYARFLAMKSVEEGRADRGIDDGAAKLEYDRLSGRIMRTLLDSRSDLQAFTRYAAEALNPVREEMARLERTYGEVVEEAQSLERELSDLTRQGVRAQEEMARVVDELTGPSVSPARAAELSRRRDELVREIDGLNTLIRQRNALYVARGESANRIAADGRRPRSSLSVISIGGGINLGPEEFTIRVRPSSGGNPARRTGGAPSATAPRRIPPPSAPARPEIVTAVPQVSPRRIVAGPSPDRSRFTAAPSTGLPSARRLENYWFRRDGSRWNERVVTGARTRERSYDPASRTLTVTDRLEDGGARSLSARRVGDGRIEFRRGTTGPAPASGEPEWWNAGPAGAAR